MHIGAKVAILFGKIMTNESIDLFIPLDGEVDAERDTKLDDGGAFTHEACKRPTTAPSAYSIETRISELAEPLSPLRLADGNGDRKIILLAGKQFSPASIIKTLLSCDEETLAQFLEIDSLRIKQQEPASENGLAISKITPVDFIFETQNETLKEKAIRANPAVVFKAKAPLLYQMQVTQKEGAFERYKIYQEHLDKAAALILIDPKVDGEATAVPLKVTMNGYLTLATKLGVPAQSIRQILGGKMILKNLKVAIAEQAKKIGTDGMAKLIKPSPWEIVTSVRCGLENVLQDENIIRPELFDRIVLGEETDLEKKVFSIDPKTLIATNRSLCEEDPEEMETFMVRLEELYGVIRYYKDRLEALRQILASLITELEKVSGK